MAIYNSLKLSLNQHPPLLLLRGVNFVIVFAIIVVASSALAQKPDAQPTLVPGSEVNLSAVAEADWVQGEGPTAFEPGKVYAVSYTHLTLPTKA